MIGGNIQASILEKNTKKNEIGENIIEWNVVNELNLIGFLDYMTGDSNYTTYNSKLADSTHVFICDYIDFKFDLRQHSLLIDDELYDITFIDDPMKLHQHLEIYLKTNEGYNGNNIYQ